jgi:hypothetical protein
MPMPPQKIKPSSHAQSVFALFGKNQRNHQNNDRTDPPMPSAMCAPAINFRGRLKIQI